MRDKEFGAVRLRCFGIYSYRISDPRLFFNQVSGTRQCYFAADLEGQLRDTIVAHMTGAFANSGLPFLDLAANQALLGQEIAERVKPMFASLGLELYQVVVENISLPDELSKVLDQRIGMGLVGDVKRYTQYAAAESLDLAAANTGGGAGVGMGLGAGAAVAQVLASSLKATAAAPDPVSASPASSAPAAGADTKFCIECGQPIAIPSALLLRVRQAAVNCPACGAPITLKPDTEGFRCDYCHAVFHPGEEDDGVVVADANANQAEALTGLACPICAQALVDATITKVQVRYCTECRGILLPMGTLPALIEARRQGVAPAVQEPPDRGDLKRIQCPQCHQRMDTHYYAGPGNVILDSWEFVCLARPRRTDTHRTRARRGNRRRTGLVGIVRLS